MTAIDISNILVNAGPFGIASIFIWLFMDERKANRVLSEAEKPAAYQEAFAVFADFDLSV